MKKRRAIQLVASIVFLVVSTVGVWVSGTVENLAGLGMFLIMANVALLGLLESLTAKEFEKQLRQLKEEIAKRNEA